MQSSLYQLNGSLLHRVTLGTILIYVAIPFHTFLSMNVTGLLLPGWSRSEDRTSGERAKLEFSFLPNKRLAVRLSATARTCTTMRGRTRELGGAARIRTL